MEYKEKKIIYYSEKTQVRLVEDIHTGQQAVEKILNKRNENLPYIYEIIKNEKHPNIPQIYKFIETEDNYHIIEEYISFKTLGERIENGEKFKKKTIVKIMKQLCSVLIFLHSHNIIHRDIKPLNLIMQDNGIIKLIDFDSARFYVEDNSKDTKYQGTKGYAAPEQYGYAQTDVRTDIYELGVTAYELLKGIVPTDNKFKCHGILGEIIKKCSKFDPKRRYKSVNAILISLETIWLKKIIKILLSACIGYIMLIIVIMNTSENAMQAGKAIIQRTYLEMNAIAIAEKTKCGLDYMGLTPLQIIEMYGNNYTLEETTPIYKINMCYENLPYMFKVNSTMNNKVGKAEIENVNEKISTVIVKNGGYITSDIKVGITIEELSKITGQEIKLRKSDLKDNNYAIFYVDNKFMFEIFVDETTKKIIEAKITYANMPNVDIKYDELKQLPIIGTWKVDDTDEFVISEFYFGNAPYSILKATEDTIEIIVDYLDGYSSKLLIVMGKNNKEMDVYKYNEVSESYIMPSRFYKIK